MSSERDCYFDNYKAILIILVVIAHFIGPVSKRFGLVECIYKFIFLFHMPAFIFICGYFAKHNDLIKLIRKILIPYMILQIIYFFLYNYLWGEPRRFSFIAPAYTMWFLLCLFAWRIIIDKVKDIKGLLIICMVFGLLAGFFDIIGKALSLSRMIVFFPYFIMGYRFDRDQFMKYADKWHVKVLAGLFLCGVFAFVAANYDNVSIRLLEASYSYDEMKLPYGWLLRIILYIISTGLIFSIAVFIPKRKHWFSYLGSRTMGIYMVHGAILKTITYCTDWYDSVDTTLEVIFVFAAAFLLCLILSTRQVNQAVGWMGRVPIERLLAKHHT